MSTIKLKSTDIQCNICEQWYDESMELCPSCNKTNKPKTNKSTETIIVENNQSNNKYEYPALEFIIVFYAMLSILGMIGSVILFIFLLEKIGLLQSFLFMVCTWIVMIFLYSYTELIRIFIRIEQNTRK
tara:strand:- start:92 stop:478 length:387 start_codon:yes stop_codon:yes gene_type:complete